MTYINPQRHPYEDPPFNPYRPFSGTILDKYKQMTDTWSINKLGLFAKQNLTFSEALYYLKKGKKVKRTDWKTYLTLGNEKVPSNLYKTLTKEQKDLLHNFIKDSEVYTLSKEDILAEDWELYCELDNIQVKF